MSAVLTFILGILFGYSVPSLLIQLEDYFPETYERIAEYIESKQLENFGFDIRRRTYACCIQQRCLPCAIELALIEKDLKRLLNRLYAHRLMPWASSGQHTSIGGSVITSCEQIQGDLRQIALINDFTFTVCKYSRRFDWLTSAWEPR